jgi:hypothetical protein
MCRWGLRAAQAQGDPLAEGLMRSGLGVACIADRRFDEALASLHEALPLMRECRGRRGEGHVHNNIAVAWSNLGRFDQAVAALGQALAVHAEGGYRLGVALARNNIGELGLAELGAALEIVQEIGNLRLEASIRHSLGDATLACGDLDAAPHSRSAGGGEPAEHHRRVGTVLRRPGHRRAGPARAQHGGGCAPSLMMITASASSILPSDGAEILAVKTSSASLTPSSVICSGIETVVAPAGTVTRCPFNDP